MKSKIFTARDTGKGRNIYVYIPEINISQVNGLTNLPSSLSPSLYYMSCYYLLFKNPSLSLPRGNNKVSVSLLSFWLPKRFSREGLFCFCCWDFVCQDSGQQGCLLDLNFWGELKDLISEVLEFRSKFCTNREMAQSSHVPKFGNWESDENVPYTAFFDNARKGRRGGKVINPNDPLENPDIVSKPEGPSGSEAVRRTHERHGSREDSDLKQFANSPARHENTNGRAGNELAPQRYGGRGVGSGETHKPPARQSAGSENSFERLPLHHHAGISGKSSGAPSPAWEGKGSHESGHATPGRSRLRPRGNESPDNGAAVPKFGDWDESNPASADGYTHIFNKVREERQAGMVPGVPTEPPYAHVRKPPPSDSAKSCCFPWGRK